MSNLEMQVEPLNRVANGLVILLKGRIDSKTVPLFQERIDDIKEREKKGNIVLNLEEVDYINSTGLGTLVKLGDRIENEGGRLALANLQEGVRVPMESLGVDAFFDLYETAEEARQTLRREDPAPEEDGSSDVEPEPVQDEDIVEEPQEELEADGDTDEDLEPLEISEDEEEPPEPVVESEEDEQEVEPEPISPDMFEDAGEDTGEPETVEEATVEMEEVEPELEETEDASTDDFELNLDEEPVTVEDSIEQADEADAQEKEPVEEAGMEEEKEEEAEAVEGESPDTETREMVESGVTGETSEVSCENCGAILELNTEQEEEYMCPRCSTLISVAPDREPKFFVPDGGPPISMTVNCRKESTQGLAAFLKALADERGFEGKRLTNLADAVKKSASLIYQSAYGENRNCTYQVLVQVEDSEIRVRFADHGRKIEGKTDELKDLEANLDQITLSENPEGGNILTLELRQ